jgi:hypothetical protein
MYVTAHRVVSPSTGAEGVNAFHYIHGGYVWEGAPPPEFHPETNPGTLFNDAVEVPPPGNRVRSYLDVVAPDDTPAGEIERAVAEATAREVPSRFPATWTTGRLWVRLGLEGALVPVWRQELRLLLERVVSLLGNAPRL